MKFRYKVILINIILLSIGIGAVGYFMIRRNFQLAIDNQVKTAVAGNNLFQSSLEYSLLSRMSGDADKLSEELSLAAQNCYAAYHAEKNSSLYIIYDDETVFQSDNKVFPEHIIQDTAVGQKAYSIVPEQDTPFIYVTSCIRIYEKNLYILSKRDISSIYELTKSEELYFTFLLLGIIFICSFILFLVCFFLTGPLERLAKTTEEFGAGNYTVRSTVSTKDEIGALANTYNTMADAVEEHIESLQDMLEQKDQFVADFSHEMKTPMTSIIGYADTLRSRELNREDQILAANYIVSEGRRLESLSRKLFDLIYSKNEPIEMQDFPLSYLLDAVISSTAPALNSKQIKLFVDYSDETLKKDTLHGSFDLLETAFINLVDNAKKATPEQSSRPKEIHITVSDVQSQTEESADLLITVKDYGIGIPPEHLEKIWHEFYMVDKSRSRKEGGSGLGLSLTKQIFDRHAYTITLESTVDEGSCFSISIPKQFPKE